MEQIRSGRIPFRPKHLMQRLHMNPGLLRQRRKALRLLVVTPERAKMAHFLPSFWLRGRKIASNLFILNKLQQNFSSSSSISFVFNHLEAKNSPVFRTLSKNRQICCMNASTLCRTKTPAYGWQAQRKCFSLKG
jgi:hypothetical protein